MTVLPKDTPHHLIAGFRQGQQPVDSNAGDGVRMHGQVGKWASGGGQVGKRWFAFLPTCLPAVFIRCNIFFIPQGPADFVQPFYYKRFAEWINFEQVCRSVRFGDGLRFEVY